MDQQWWGFDLIELEESWLLYLRGLKVRGTRFRFYDFKLTRDTPRPPQTPKNQVNTTITYAKDDIGGQPDHSTRPTNVNDLLVDLR